jgi:defect-in-organelle-trafficking protein DotA
MFWNGLISPLFSVFLGFIGSLLNMVVQELLVLPLSAIMAILNEGVQTLNTSQAHPIIGMAYMGAQYVNFVIETYFRQLALAPFIVALGASGAVLTALYMPFLAAWSIVLLTIGMIDAYYVPFLPYMIFTFGSIAWFMAVIEAMVAGPIIALGVTHPEGHDALGKAEQALTILINVFLRPALMVIGYIVGIALCYVAVYVVNSGFSHVMQFLMPTGGATINAAVQSLNPYSDAATSPYTSYASMFAGFMCLIIYTSIYLTVVEKSFQLIYLLPDNISRWMGGQAESYGKETAQWTDATRKQVETGGEQSGKGAYKTQGDLTNAVLGDSSAISKKALDIESPK